MGVFDYYHRYCERWAMTLTCRQCDVMLRVEWWNYSAKAIVAEDICLACAPDDDGETAAVMRAHIVGVLATDVKSAVEAFLSQHNVFCHVVVAQVSGPREASAPAPARAIRLRGVRLREEEEQHGVVRSELERLERLRR